MKNTTPMDANALLSLPIHRAGELFQGAVDDMKTAYRRMVHRWHPDHNPDPKAHEVFIHLQALYQAATARKQGVDLDFTSETGQHFRFHAQARTSFELGWVYRGKGSIAYLVSSAHSDAARNFQAKITSLAYANDAMRAQFSPQLPTLHAIHHGPDGVLMIVKRDPETVLLRDLVDYHAAHGTKLDPRHVGWILNGLHNLACFMAHNGVAHHAIGLDTVWINPRLHSIQVLGGWFHALKFGQPIRTLPTHAAQMAPRSYLREKVASGRLDQECIRGAGRALLGDPNGHRFDPDAPIQMTSLLRLPATGTALEEYQRWKQVLHASFGPPKFVDMKLSFNEIYQGE